MIKDSRAKTKFIVIVRQLEGAQAATEGSKKEAAKARQARHGTCMRQVSDEILPCFCL